MKKEKKEKKKKERKGRAQYLRAAFRSLVLALFFSPAPFPAPSRLCTLSTCPAPRLLAASSRLRPDWAETPQSAARLGRWDCIC